MFWRKKSYFDNSAPDIKNRRKQPCQVRYMAPIEQFFVTLNVATPDLFARFDKRKDRQKLRQAINPSAGMLRSGLIKVWALTMKLASGGCYRASPMTCKNCFRWWFVAIKHQAIAWANVDPDLYPHMVSPGHNELIIDCMFNCLIFMLWYTRKQQPLAWLIQSKSSFDSQGNQSRFLLRFIPFISTNIVDHHALYLCFSSLKTFELQLNSQKLFPWGLTNIFIIFFYLIIVFYRQWYGMIHQISHFNSLRSTDAYMRQEIIPPLFQIMASHLFGAKPLSESMLLYCQLDPNEHISVKFYLKFKSFHSRKCTWKCHLRNDISFVLMAFVLMAFNTTTYYAGAHISCYNHWSNLMERGWETINLAGFFYQWVGFIMD